MGPDLLLYRRLHFGQLATFHVLDTRQYRSDQPACEDAKCAEAFDPSRTMLGAEQENWLLRGLGSGAGWDVLAQQVPVYEDAPSGCPPTSGTATAPRARGCSGHSAYAA